ncbi:MAG: acyl-CoA dehydrogenase family protein [Planctomycetes bacterium]|nr:acyl-CoA dehydrogenase family protein [Planctomycetota bacterium]MBI3835772.1 acyl-CoA dehydrogenase family protein [Planctomycetota bacterium]
MSLIPADVSVSDDDLSLVHAVHDFAQNELLPLDRKWDRGQSDVSEILPRLSEMGLLNLLVPHDLGGLGLSYRTYVAILHALAEWSPSTSVTVAVHSLVGGLIDRFATESLRAKCLSRWGEASSFAAFSVSEADAGSDASAAKTTAVEVADGFIVNGEKMWVTNGMTAEWLFTLVRLKGHPEREHFCGLLIDARSPGITRQKIRGKMGIRGSETAVISLSDVSVPAEQIIGRRGDGLGVCLKSLGRGRVGIAAQATGIAEACLTEMIAYARQREQFGRPIGKFQAIGDMIAQSAVELEAAKTLVWRAAATIDAGVIDRTATSMAKLYASEAANRIAYRAVQVHGGTGYVNECRVEQLYRDARITTIYEGTSEIQRLVIARELSG